MIELHKDVIYIRRLPVAKVCANLAYEGLRIELEQAINGEYVDKQEHDDEVAELESQLENMVNRCEYNEMESKFENWRDRAAVLAKVLADIQKINDHKTLKNATKLEKIQAILDEVYE